MTGYRAHAVVEPATGLFTDGELTRATGEDNSDPAVAERMFDREDQPVEGYGDSAYGTGDLRGFMAQGGHTAVIKPKPLQAAVAGGFTVDDFTVDEAAGTATCPAGVTRPISVTRVVTFGAACGECPLRTRCTTSKTGRKLVLHEHDALLRQARRDWANNPQLREDYTQHRPQVERGIAQLVRHCGRRLKLRYIGVTKNDFWLHMRLAALNLRRMVSFGLTRQAGAWAIAVG